MTKSNIKTINKPCVELPESRALNIKRMTINMEIPGANKSGKAIFNVVNR